jgi:hypothetical protein
MLEKERLGKSFAISDNLSETMSVTSSVDYAMLMPSDESVSVSEEKTLSIGAASSAAEEVVSSKDEYHNLVFNAENQLLKRFKEAIEKNTKRLTSVFMAATVYLPRLAVVVHARADQIVDAYKKKTKIIPSVTVSEIAFENFNVKFTQWGSGEKALFFTADAVYVNNLLNKPSDKYHFPFTSSGVENENRKTVFFDKTRPIFQVVGNDKDPNAISVGLHMDLADGKAIRAKLNSIGLVADIDFVMRVLRYVGLLKSKALEAMKPSAGNEEIVKVELGHSKNYSVEEELDDIKIECVDVDVDEQEQPETTNVQLQGLSPAAFLPLPDIPTSGNTFKIHNAELLQTDDVKIKPVPVPQQQETATKPYQPSLSSIRLLADIESIRIIVPSASPQNYSKCDSPSIFLTLSVRAALFVGPALGTALRDFSDEEYVTMTKIVSQFYPNWGLLSAYYGSKLGNAIQLQEQLNISDKENAVVTTDAAVAQTSFDVNFKNKRPPWRALVY